MTLGGAERSATGLETMISDTSIPPSSFSSPRIIVSMSLISKDSTILKSASESTNSPSDPRESRFLDSAMTLKKRSMFTGEHLPFPPKRSSFR